MTEVASCSSSQPPVSQDEVCKQYKPTNQGSKDHPLGCKPCNKFNPARPGDSCKHGEDCDFCHMEHERPKHRGQRGRHALQRRQYLENRSEQPLYFRDLVDEIYQRPHEAIDRVKRELQNLSQHERDEKVKCVLFEIRRIGVEAQEARPDHNRLRGAISIQECETICSVAELDGRCKWLVGTLHLMVRKMYECKEPQDKIKSVVECVLKKCEKLHEIVPDRSCPPGYRSTGIGGNNGTQGWQLPPRFYSLRQKVNELLKEEDETGDPPQLPEDLRREFDDLEDTTQSMNEDELNELIELIKSRKSLEELALCLKNKIEVVERFKQRRWEELDKAESLEDMGNVKKQTTTVHWKGDVFKEALIIGSSAQDLREKLAERLPSQSQAPHLDAPSVNASQVRLGVVGLAVELDYHQAVPEAVKDHLKVSVVREYWEDIVNTWPRDSFVLQKKLSELIRKWVRTHGNAKACICGKDFEASWRHCPMCGKQRHLEEGWASSDDFCRVVGIIDILLRRFKRCPDENAEKDLVDLVENAAARTDNHPSTLLKEINHRFFESHQLIPLYHLLGESDVCLHMKLDTACKFLDITISRLTQEALQQVQNEEDLHGLQSIQIQIKDECDSLPSTFDLLTDPLVAKVQEKLTSMPTTLDNLLQMLRDVVRRGTLESIDESQSRAAMSTF